MQDLLKIVKSLEDSCILLNRITETVKNEVKEQKGGFLSMLFGTLGASLLGDLLTKKVIRQRCYKGWRRNNYSWRRNN